MGHLPLPVSPPNYLGDSKMNRRSSVDHSKVSTDETELWCCSVVLTLAVVKHISTLGQRWMFNPYPTTLLPSCLDVLEIVIVNVQFNYLVFYLTVLTMFYSSIFNGTFCWWCGISVVTFFFFFVMSKAKKEKTKTLNGQMVSVKKKRFILYRQQSILCNVADIKHFGGKKWKSVFHKSHRLLYIVIHTHVEKWTAYIILDMGLILL